MRIAAAWLLGVVAWATFVAVTSVGPVVFSLGWRHGVHASDVFVGLVVVAVCLSYTLHRSTQSGQRSADQATGAHRQRQA